MRNDFLYLDNGNVNVSDAAMEIPSFKNCKRYDTSPNKRYFQYVLNYIYFVYQIYGEDASYLAELPLNLRKKKTVEEHTGNYKKVSDFEDNQLVVKCITDYLQYTRTSNENMLDQLKDDVEAYINYCRSIPLTIKEKIKVDRPDPNNPDEIVPIEFLIDVPNSERRLKALEGAEKYSDMYDRLKAKVVKDSKKKRNTNFMFENKEITDRIPLSPENISESN